MEQPLAAPTHVETPAADISCNGRPARADHAAFERVMRRHNQRLFRLAVGLIGDPVEAEDVLQESYIQAFLNLASFAGRASLGTWLASIVRNRAIDHLRSRRARRASFALEADLPYDGGEDRSPLERVAAPADSASPEHERERAELRGILENAIALLPGQFRAVFVLRELEGLSVQQTAIFLGIPIATVKTRDHRARLLLRAMLGPAFDGDASGAFEFLRERCDRIVSRVLSRLV